MTALQTRHLLRCRAAHDAHRARRFKAAIRAEAHKRDFPVVLRYLVGHLKAVNLIEAAALFLHLLVVVQAVELSVLKPALLLFSLCSSEDFCQRVAEVYAAFRRTFKCCCSTGNKPESAVVCGVFIGSVLA